jgi:hypothetical protein
MISGRYGWIGALGTKCITAKAIETGALGTKSITAKAQKKIQREERKRNAALRFKDAKEYKQDLSLAIHGLIVNLIAI